MKQVLQTTRQLAGFGVTMVKNFAPEIRNIRKGLMPYLKDAKRIGLETFLRKDKLLVNGYLYDLAYLLNNVQLSDANREIDTPGMEPTIQLESISQHALGSANR
jgi:hypothetical protein